MKDERNILMYLSKNHMQKNCTLNLGEKKLLIQLEKLGFHRVVIDQTVTWLNSRSYSVRKPIQLPQKNSCHVFSDYECELPKECRRFLLILEQQGILFHTREFVTNQVIELLAESLDISLLRLITLIMVLFSHQSDKNRLLQVWNY